MHIYVLIYHPYILAVTRQASSDLQHLGLATTGLNKTVFSARCNIYISRLCYDVSVRLSVMEVHWRIIANLGFKLRSQFIIYSLSQHQTVIYSNAGQQGPRKDTDSCQKKKHDMTAMHFTINHHYK